MDTVGYLFILVAALAIRGMTKGRTIADLPKDIGDLFVGVLSGDKAQVSAALGRTGTPATTATTNDATATATAPISQSQGINGLQGATTSTKALGAVTFARAQIGKPYVWGATGPNGFDCSGLVVAAYKSQGMSLTRTTYTQVLQGKAVAQKDLQIGDLVFPDAGHVQLYSGNGMIVEAPHTGANVREVKMWGFWRARRVV